MRVVVFVLFITVVCLTADVLELQHQNDYLRAHRTITEPTLPTTEACAAWLFHSDLAAAKRRICGK